MSATKPTTPAKPTTTTVGAGARPAGTPTRTTATTAATPTRTSTTATTTTPRKTTATTTATATPRTSAIPLSSARPTGTTTTTPRSSITPSTTTTMTTPRTRTTAAAAAAPRLSANPVTPSKPVTSAPTRTPTNTPAKPPTSSNMVTFECRICKFKMTRAQADVNKDCVKCQTPHPYKEIRAAPIQSPTTTRKPTIAETLAQNKTPIIPERGAGVKKNFACQHCQFKLSRFESDLQKDCPKCLKKNPYLDPTKAKPSTRPSTSATGVSTKKCPKRSDDGVHEYSLGSCRYCKGAQGVLEGDGKGPTPAAYRGGVAAGCAKNNGAKHIFKFSKCTFCGLSELEHQKQVKSASSSTTTMTSPRVGTARSSVGATTPSKATTVAPKPTTTTPSKPVAKPAAAPAPEQQTAEAKEEDTAVAVPEEAQTDETAQ